MLESNGSKLDDLNLRGGDFFDPRHGGIYDAMLTMQASQMPIDVGTVGLQLPKQNVFLWTISDQVAHTASTDAELVREAAVRRRVKAAGVRI